VFSFENPNAFFLIFLPVAVLLFFLIFKPSKNGVFLFHIENRDIFKQAKRTKHVLIALFLILLLLLSSISFLIARPIKFESWQEKFINAIDIIICLDTSDSMSATDFLPDRISVAKTVIRDFIRRRSGDRIGLVLFGGKAITKSPLTIDHDFILNELESIELGKLSQGTAIGMGITNAVLRLRNSKSKTKVIILLTDGDNNVGAINPVSAALLAREENIKIYTIGIGKENRVIVSVYSEDQFGKKYLAALVPSYLNPELLFEISELTNAKMYLAKDPTSLSKILRDIDELEKTKLKIIPHGRKIELFFVPATIILFMLFTLYFLLQTRYRRNFSALR